MYTCLPLGEWDSIITKDYTEDVQHKNSLKISKLYQNFHVGLVILFSEKFLSIWREIFIMLVQTNFIQTIPISFTPLKSHETFS